MKRGWLLAVVATTLMGCIGPFADTVDEALQDTPGDYDECCMNAERPLLGKLAGTPITVVTAPDFPGFRVDAVVTTHQFDAATEKKVTWEKDGDGLIAPDDAHDYVLALVAGVPRADKSYPQTVITVGKGSATYESTPLVDPSDGSRISSVILAVRVPAGQTVLLTAEDPAPGDPAVDLRTGRAVKFPADA
ncbi:hypothetical protein [Dactylosporangium sp. NPDC006015]|uniref:hypothetical protein n=1 Tax=Dactylosporangium sp. NPDC006015 TaxID=3154576 RepID=UPI0033A320AA